jgi:hypothetical protein
MVVGGKEPQSRAPLGHGHAVRGPADELAHEPVEERHPALGVAGDDAGLGVVQHGLEQLAFGGQRLFGQDAVGDLDGHAAEQALAEGVLHRKARDQPVVPAAGGRGELLDGRGGLAADQHARVRLAQRAGGLVGQQFEVGFVEHVGLEAEQLVEALVAIHVAAELVLDEGGAGRVAHEGVEARLALEQPLGGPPALERVADGALEHDRREGVLGEVVRRAAAHGLLVHRVVPLPRQQDDREVLAEVADLAENLQAGARAEAVVHQAHVVAAARDGLQRGVVGRCPVHDVLAARDFAQRVGEQHIIVLVVLDQQHADGLWGHGLRSPGSGGSCTSCTQ